MRICNVWNVGKRFAEIVKFNAVAVRNMFAYNVELAKIRQILREQDVLIIQIKELKFCVTIVKQMIINFEWVHQHKMNVKIAILIIAIYAGNIWELLPTTVVNIEFVKTVFKMIQLNVIHVMELNEK